MSTPMSPLKTHPTLPPDILPLVGCYLLPVDLLQCVQVNQEWNTALIPLLWHTIDSSLSAWHKILQEYDSEHAQGQKDEQWLQLLFNKHAHHIRSLKVHHRDLLRFVGQSGTCTRLLSLEVFHLDGNETLKEHADQDYNIWHGQGVSSLDECEERAFSDIVLSPLFEGVFRPEESRCRSLTSQKRDWFALQHFWLLVLTNSGLTFLHMSRNLRCLGNFVDESGPLYYKALSGLKNLITFSDPYYRLSLPALLESLPLVKHLHLEMPKWNRLLDATYPHLETLELREGNIYIGDVFNILKHCPNVVYLRLVGVMLQPMKYYEDMKYGGEDDEDDEQEVVLFGVEDARKILGDTECRLERLRMNGGANFEYMDQFLPLLPYLIKCYYEEEYY
ncbi:hypothetical protein BG015_005762 [Linnemannia schmuckeri]|uniref:F-box domain-containing protein n=1 Tax=Linnemannia schmuckeri TaxID=64567 RepID=A0A9P5S0M2_9FUNG|nr:hypothetical protein BG015_005762 [Linnemannia schmuckeri]